jgi:hypothetical protein
VVQLLPEAPDAKGPDARDGEWTGWARLERAGVADRDCGLVASDAGARWIIRRWVSMPFSDFFRILVGKTGTVP